MARASIASVVAATLADFAIAAADLLAAVFGGSSAMLAESIHSAVDGMNGLLLLFGLKRSRRPPDEHHPFGHGKELYFWALIVSCSIFATGGGVSFFEGVMRIRHPEPLSHTSWAFAALGCGAAFDAASFFYSLRKFRKQNRDKGFWEAVDETKDPSILMVVFEDFAAFVGQLIAAAGIFLQIQGWPMGDGIASILIGCLMAATAVYLIAQHRDLIVGEGVEDEISRCIRELAIGDERFLSVRAAHSVHFGPETVLVTLETVFDPNRTAGELMEAVDRIQRSIRERFPAVKFIYIDPQSSSREATGAGVSKPQPRPAQPMRKVG